MKIKTIKLKNYRNCENIELDLNAQKILIIGKNAQGKTNILESIYFLSSFKSPRTNNYLELINIEKEKLEIKAKINKNNTDIELDFSYDKNKKRYLKINKVKTNKQKEFKKIIKVVLFSSQDLLLLRGSPQNRRDWLDLAISQIYPAYDERLSKYNKIRMQKNTFLKEQTKFCKNEMLLDVYNEQLIVLGSNIIYLRKKFLKEIETTASVKHSIISKKEKLTIKYDCPFLEEDIIKIEEISIKFKQKIEEIKKEEIKRGQTLIGPHRDDIVFYIDDKESTKFASQGQQRTIVLALKLAELNIITQKTKESPILLLDDVLAELDDLRQNYLLKSIDKKIQTVITSVDTLLFNKKFLKEVKIYKVNDGKIINE